MTEHLVPKGINTKWKETHTFKDNYDETKTFHSLMREKESVTAKFRIRYVFTSLSVICNVVGHYIGLVQIITGGYKLGNE